MTGKPVLLESAHANVLFPDPIIPSTRTRRPIIRDTPFMAQSVPEADRSSRAAQTDGGDPRNVVGADTASWVGEPAWAVRGVGPLGLG
jgi:hypothetical protein